MDILKFVAYPMPSNQPLNIFISYSHKDKDLREELDIHLMALHQEGKIKSWYDGDIKAGENWSSEIKKNLCKSDVILLLISPNYIASQHCYNIEMKWALEQHRIGISRVIPIILKPSDWKNSPFSKLQILPENGIPITLWDNQDEAFYNVAISIRNAVNSLRNPDEFNIHGNQPKRQKYFVRKTSINKIINKKYITIILTAAGISISIIFLRLLGFFQPLELSLYDSVLRIRPNETPDKRISVITATAKDLKAQRERNEERKGSYSISDTGLREILRILRQEQSKPSMIVFNLYRDLKNDPLSDIFKTIKDDPEQDLFIPCKLSNVDNSAGVDPPSKSFVSADYIGFSDLITDSDGVLRRHIIKGKSEDAYGCKSEKSLSLQIALRYFERQTKRKLVDSKLETVFKRIDNYAFGAYQYIDARGDQFMLNYRSPIEHLDEITELYKFEDIRKQELPKFLKGRIVIIGVTDPNLANDFDTPYGRAYGVTIQAHMISQLISLLVDNRSLIWAWPQWGEAIWIVIWAILGSFINIYSRSRYLVLISIMIGSLMLIFIAIIIMIQAAGWIPILTPLVAFIVAGTTAKYFSQRIIPSIKRVDHK